MSKAELQIRLVEPRPRIFEATYVTEDNLEAIKQWATKDCFVESYLDIRNGCWVVKRSSGSVEILEPDDFHAHYKSAL
nr:MAG TPA: PGDYG protein [Caudoviricetes sp.]